MTALLIAAGAFIALSLVVGLVVCKVAPGPRLDPTPPPGRVPASAGPQELDAWLARHEATAGHVVEGAEATIIWHGGKTRAEYCLLYLHGFSATRQETAPLAEDVARNIGANVVCARLAGHGLSRDAMLATAEEWLASVRDAFEIAARIGDKVIIIATSTGAPLAVWASHHLDAAESVSGMIFCSPNFRVRHPLGSLLTWPLATRWAPLLIGREQGWEPESELVARYWTYRYETSALIEMQKVVDWARRHRREISRRNIPLLTLYMARDPTVSTAAAIAFHNGWAAQHKELREVTLDKANPQHVFAGRITAPHRLPWTVEACLSFIGRIRQSPFVDPFIDRLGQKPKGAP